VTRKAHEAGVTDIRELYNLLVVADTKSFEAFWRYARSALPDEHNGRMFDSIAIGHQLSSARSTT